MRHTEESTAFLPPTAPGPAAGTGLALQAQLSTVHSSEMEVPPKLKLHVTLSQKDRQPYHRGTFDLKFYSAFSLRILLILPRSLSWHAPLDIISPGFASEIGAPLALTVESVGRRAGMWFQIKNVGCSRSPPALQSPSGTRQCYHACQSPVSGWAAYRGDMLVLKLGKLVPRLRLQHGASTES